MLNVWIAIILLISNLVMGANSPTSANAATIGSSCTNVCTPGSGLLCIAGKCLLKYGETCQNGTECASGVCNKPAVDAGSEPALICGCKTANDCPNHANLCNTATGLCTCLAQSAPCITGASTGNTSCCNGDCYVMQPPNINGFCPTCPNSCTAPSDCEPENGCDVGLACTYMVDEATGLLTGSGTCSTCVGNNVGCIAYQYAEPQACQSAADCGSDNSCVNQFCIDSNGVAITIEQWSDNCCVGYSCNNNNLCVPDQAPTSSGVSSAEIGMIVGAVVGAAAAGGGFYWWYTRSKRNGSNQRTKITKAIDKTLEADPNLRPMQQTSEQAKIVQALLDPNVKYYAQDVITVNTDRSAYYLMGKQLMTKGGIQLAQEVLRGGVPAALKWFQAQPTTVFFVDSSGNVYTNVSTDPVTGTTSAIKFSTINGEPLDLPIILDENIAANLQAVTLKLQLRGKSNPSTQMSLIAGRYQLNSAALGSYQASFIDSIATEVSNRTTASLTEFCAAYPNVAAKLALFVKYRCGNLAMPKIGNHPAYMTAIGEIMLQLLKDAQLIRVDATLNKELVADLTRAIWTGPGTMQLKISALDPAMINDPVALQTAIQTLTPDEYIFWRTLTGGTLGQDFFASIPDEYDPGYQAWLTSAATIAQAASLGEAVNDELVETGALVEAE